MKTLNNSRLLDIKNIDQESDKYNIHDSDKIKYGDFMGYAAHIVNLTERGNNDVIIYSFLKNYETDGVDVYLDTQISSIKKGTYIADHSNMLRDSATGEDFSISKIESSAMRDAYILMLEDLDEQIKFVDGV